MTQFFRRLAIACFLTIAASFGVMTVAHAQTGGPYDLSWHNIGPGGSASGGSYSPDASIVWQRLLSTR
jgi:hypothetical protein